ncbi:ATP-binding cassette domain-containing protein [Streptomyces sp. NPDC052036]|uniref:ATP-binding cassette domain-containing protein n=1 Tax=Streptomyces sp. NPDC052036 TaxID=3155171 RepID=UPI003421F9D6
MLSGVPCPAVGVNAPTAAGYVVESRRGGGGCRDVDRYGQRARRDGGACAAGGEAAQASVPVLLGGRGGGRSRAGDLVRGAARIDHQMHAGEVAALLGKSGSGKSTLLRCLAGLVPASSGTVTYKGTPLTGANPGTAMVFQTFALLPWLTGSSAWRPRESRLPSARTQPGRSST